MTLNQLVFRSVTVREPGTGGQDVETRSSRSYLTTDEMDTVPNSQARQRTVMASGALSVFLNYGRLWLLVVISLHGDRESHILRPWTTSTRHGDRDHPTEKVGQIVSHCSAG